MNIVVLAGMAACLMEDAHELPLSQVEALLWDIILKTGKDLTYILQPIRVERLR